jgi:ketosteroid isomerase-like protein
MAIFTARTYNFDPMPSDGSSSPNIALIEQGLAGFAERGVDALVELITDDFEFTTPPALAAEPDTYTGEEGMRRYWDSFYEVMETIELIPGRMEDVGGRVVVELTLRATGRRTGITADQTVFTVWSVRGEQASGLGVHATWEDAVEAASAAEG